jgi:hypothetical protein
LNELDFNPQLGIDYHVRVNGTTGLARAVGREPKLLQQFADFTLTTLAFLFLHFTHQVYPDGTPRLLHHTQRSAGSSRSGDHLLALHHGPRPISIRRRKGSNSFDLSEV